MTTTAPVGEGPGIRRAERADLFDVLRIEQASFPQPWPLAAFDGFLGEPGFLVASDGAQVVGYVVADTATTPAGPIGHVKDLAVHPDHRGRGIGGRLLERALAILDAAGSTRVRLEVRESNGPAIRLYRRFGFRYRDRIRRYYDDGEDAIVLVAERSP